MNRTNSIWNEMRRMQEQMDYLFEDFFSGDSSLLNAPSSSYKQPVSDIYETQKDVVAEIEMPGLDKKDIKVNVTKDGIEVKAETNSEIKHEDEKKGIYRMERNYSGFYRHFNLPSNIDPDKAVADYKNGVLKISVPKTAIEEQKKKFLPIN